MPLQISCHRNALPEWSITRPSAFTLQCVGEMVDWILDFLHDDVSTLMVCSLVCRAWLPATRFHLFRSFVLSRKNRGEFFPLLSSPHSLLPTVIRSLRIQGHSNIAFWKLTRGFMKGIASLTALRSLTLHRVDIRGLSLNGVKLLNAIDVRDLTMVGVRAEHTYHVTQIPCAFPRLECLTLRHIFVYEMDSTSNSPVSLTLRELTIDSDSYYSFGKICAPRNYDIYSSSRLLNWIQKREPIPPISTLSIGYADPLCGKIVAMLCKSLERFDLNLNPWRRRDQSDSQIQAFKTFLESIDLSENFVLRSLLIRTGRTFLFRFIPNFLEQLQSPKIESVRFQIDFGWQDIDYETLRKEIQLRSLMQILSKHQGSLTEVAFEVQRSFEPLPFFRKLERQMKGDIGYPLADIVKLRGPQELYERPDF